MYKMYTLMALSVFILNSIVVAHQHGKGVMYRMYDTTTEVTVSGTIESIINESHSCCGSTTQHLYIVVKSKNELIKVFLGPAEFINKNIKVTKGDSITVVGSKVTMNKETVIIAKTITTGTQQLTVRNDDGTPKWAGQMRQKYQ